MKRLTLELGGHCPFVVLGDADIADAASAAARRSFSNMGQICIAVNRILVADATHEEFVEALAAETRRIRLGHGIDPGVAYGPVLHEGVRARTPRACRRRAAPRGNARRRRIGASRRGIRARLLFRADADRRRVRISRL